MPCMLLPSMSSDGQSKEGTHGLCFLSSAFCLVFSEAAIPVHPSHLLSTVRNGADPLCCALLQAWQHLK